MRKQPDPPSSDGIARAFIALLLLVGLAAMLGIAVSRNRPAAPGRESSWSKAARGALGSLESPNPLGRDPVPAVMDRLANGTQPPGGVGGLAAPEGGGAGAAGTEASAGPEVPGGAGEPAAEAGGPGGKTLDELRERLRTSGSTARSGAFQSRDPAGGLAASGAGAGSSSSASRAAQQQDVMKVFSRYIQKLKQQQAASRGARQGPGTSGGGAGFERGDYAAKSQDAAAAGGDDPSMAAIESGEGSPLMASPSYRNLLKAGKDTASGVILYQSGMTDGAKDKAGKEFDGSLKTYAPIPIEKSKGAFGKESIRER